MAGTQLVEDQQVAERLGLPDPIELDDLGRPVGTEIVNVPLEQAMALFDVADKRYRAVLDRLAAL